MLIGRNYALIVYTAFYASTLCLFRNVFKQIDMQ